VEVRRIAAERGSLIGKIVRADAARCCL